MEDNKYDNKYIIKLEYKEIPNELYNFKSTIEKIYNNHNKNNGCIDLLEIFPNKEEDLIFKSDVYDVIKNNGLFDEYICVILTMLTITDNIDIDEHIDDNINDNVYDIVNGNVDEETFDYKDSYNYIIILKLIKSLNFHVFEYFIDPYKNNLPERGLINKIIKLLKYYEMIINNN